MIAAADRMRFSHSVAITFLAKLAGAALALLTSVIIARTLGPDGRGAFAAVVALAGIGMSFGNLGLHSSNTYFLARDRSLLEPVIANSVVVSGLCGMLAAFLLGLFAWTTGMARSVGDWTLVVGLLSVPLGLAYMLLVNLLIAVSAVTRFNQIEMALKVVTLALAVAVGVSQVASPASMLVAMALAQLLALAALAMSLGMTPAILAKRDADLLRTQVPFAFRAYLASLFAFLLVRIDVLMVHHISGNVEAGHYSIAVSMADLIYMLPATAGVLLFPRLAESMDGALRRKATLKALVIVGLAMAAMSLAAALVAAPAIRLLFGESFLPSAPMFHILSVAIIAYGMNNILSNHLAAEGLPWSGIWVWVVGLVVNVALNLVWIPLYGGVGAAMASAVGYTIVLLLQAYIVFFRKESAR